MLNQLSRFIQSNKSSIGIVAVGVLILIANLAFSFTEPVEIPPGCTSPNPGCDAPVNIGSSAQVKTGNISVGGLTVVNSAIIASGNVGIGDLTPAALLTVGGGDLFQVISTGHVRGPDGAAGTPTFSFTGSTNTGMFKAPGGNRLGFSVAGTERMRIDTVGNIAVGGTLIPVYKLDILSGDINVSATGVYRRGGTGGASGSCAATSVPGGLTISGGIVTAVGPCLVTGGSGVAVQDEGLPVLGMGPRPILNFIGAGVSAVDNVALNKIDITIPGGGGGLTGSGANTQIAYWTSASDLSGSANFIWDDVNAALGIGTASVDPNYRITTAGEGIKAESTVAGNPAGYFNNSAVSAYGVIINSGSLRLASHAPASPPGGTAGAMYYDSVNSKFKCFTTGWVDCDTGGGGGGTVTSVGSGLGLSGGPITISGTLDINTVSIATCTGSTQKLLWDSTNNRLTCGTDNDTAGGSGTVTSVGSGSGMTGGPITTSGTLSINTVSIATCTGSTQKILWDSTNNRFTCDVDNGGAGGGGTVTSVGSGSGLSGGPITTTGTLSINTISISTCTGSGQKLLWDSTNNRLTCGTDNDTAGGSGTVTSVGSGAGMTGGPITTSGTLAFNTAAIATCTGSTQKLLWDSTNNRLTCGTDNDTAGGSGTVTSVATNASLSGGPITTSGTLSINLSNSNNWSVVQTFVGGANFPGTGLWNAAGNIGVGLISPAERIHTTGRVRGDGGLCIGTDCRSSWPGGGGTVTSVGSGSGLSGGPITTTGTLSINTGLISSCGGSTQKILWNGTQFSCGTDNTGGGSGTVTSVGSGTGLTGGPITTSGTLSLNLASANTWTGTQTFNTATVFNSTISVTGQINATVNANIPSYYDRDNNAYVVDPAGISYMNTIVAPGGFMFSGGAVHGINNFSGYISFYLSGSRQAAIIPGSAALDDNGWATGAIDYGEYMKKKYDDEIIKPFEIIAIRKSAITKKTNGEHKFMLTSSKLGGLRGGMDLESYENGTKKEYVVVTFSGQVPALIEGVVHEGDYLMPSGKNDGIAIAIPKEKIDFVTYKDAIGIVFEVFENPTSEILIERYGKAWEPDLKELLERKGNYTIVNVGIGVK